MADDVVPDRLADAKHLAAAAGSAEGGIILWLIGEVERLRREVDTLWETVGMAERNHLKAEVERLREKNDRQVFYGQQALDVAEEVVALRGALQALCDAKVNLQPTVFYTRADAAKYMAERAAAVALLAGPGGET